MNKPSYNDNQLSWIQSPCYDFTGIKYPYIEFRLFLDTEAKFDGVTFKYSTDNGVSWKTLGNVNDLNGCLNNIWFDTPDIQYLENKPGWTGSEYWRWRYYNFPSLAGESSVTFRFLFGSGSINNNYEGVGIDEFYAGEALPTDARFTYKCLSSKTVNFAIISNSGCPYFLWNFGDPASGSFNTSDQPNPSHIFSGPGQYKVTLSTSAVDNVPSTTTQIINILKPVAKIINTPDCKGLKNGAALVTINPAIAGTRYTWSTNPVQTFDTVTNLGAGTYSVTVTAPDACEATVNVTITEPGALSGSPIIKHPACNKNDGTIELGTAGGTAPYSYTWLPGVSNVSNAANLGAGPYFIIVKDAKGCSETLNILLTKEDGPDAIISNKQDVLCWGNGGAATVSVNGGVPPYTYEWYPSGGTNVSAVFAAGGDYSVIATDKNGCRDTTAVSIIEPGLLVLDIAKEDASCDYNNGKATANVTGGVLPLSYSWVSASATYSSRSIDNLAPANYSLTVTDKNGCKVSGNIIIAPGNIMQIVSNHEDVTCFDIQDGKASLVISGGNPGYSVTWNNGASDTMLENLGAGTYIANVIDGAGCSSMATIVIKQPPKVNVSLGADTTICSPETIVLSPGSYSSYTWQNSSSNPEFIVTNEGRYSITVTDAHGCIASSSINITADCGLVYFPNSFTPNGDDLNERFGLVGYLPRVKNYQLKIFNRWGLLVFHTNNPLEKWNGKTGNQYIKGIYVWYARYSTALQPNGTQKGTVILVF
ncbi:MAG: gliding motility-associated C-terminal domain-containing protein [Ginsengibacter sp.]